MEYNMFKKVCLYNVLLLSIFSFCYAHEHLDQIEQKIVNKKTESNYKHFKNKFQNACSLFLKIYGCVCIVGIGTKVYTLSENKNFYLLPTTPTHLAKDIIISLLCFSGAYAFDTINEIDELEQQDKKEEN